MAHTDIHPIRTTLNAAIEYIIKPQKTENGLYTNSYNCSLDFDKAAEDFLEVRAKGSGKGTVLAQHIHQSFYGKEVTPEQAIKIGEELAEKLLGGRYQYIIATHIDTDNIHNHIIFNNTSFQSCKTFESEKNRGGHSWENLREISDELCRKYGLKVIENPQQGKGKCYYEWQQDKLGKSWKSKLRYAIDETIMQSESFEDFLEKIRKKGVECVYTPDNKIKIKFRMTVQGQERFARGKTIGWYYDEPQIRRRIEQYQFLKTGVSGRTYRTKIIDTTRGVFQTSRGLLNWAEIKNMQEASRLINFLTTHGIGSEQELESTAAQTFNNRMTLVAKLNKLQQEIDDMSDVIKLLRTYKKYKSVYIGYRSSGFSEKYKKSNALGIKKYEDVVKKLTELFPDKKLPNLEKLEDNRRMLTERRTELNEQYKRIVSELKEVEFAQNSLREYMRNIGIKKSRDELE